MPTRTFLFVDQVGSTEQLSRLGDQDGHALRTALFDLLRQASHLAGGEEVDFTGDGLFCAFEGAAEAVDAAVAMQQLVWSFNRRQPADHRLGIRVGVNTGEPLESASGGYFGVGVVIAARLCSAADEGQVLAADVVQSLVAPRGVHDFTPVEPRQLKGIAEPIAVFAVDWVPDERVAALPGVLRAAISGPFVGRARESTAVMDAWESVLAGGRRLVLVSGDVGMGVSRFAAQMAHQLTADGATVWSGSGGGGHARLAGWSEALQEWAEQASRAEVRLAMGAKAGELLRLSPGLARLFPRLPPPPAMDGAAEVFLIADALDELLSRWSEHQPIVVVFDRLQEADAASLTVLRRVLESPRPGRILVIACYEPSQVGVARALAEVGQLPGLVDLRMGGLSRDEVGELLLAVSGEPASDESVRAVLAESEGSPYFVLQMATAVKAGRIRGNVTEAVGRAEVLRTDLRLQREEIILGLRQLDQLKTDDLVDRPVEVEPDGTPPAAAPCPYKGLLAFGSADAPNFFGRDLQVAELVARLVSNRFLALVGPSGSGKSSIIRAGLLPALAGGGIPGSHTWTQVLWTPTGDPLSSVIAQARSSAGDQQIVLVVDQAEQLWTTVGPEPRRCTLDLLIEAVTGPQTQVVVVLVMRADYYGRAAEHPGLARLLVDSQLLLSPMTHAELRSSIEGPARRAGLVLEPGLAQAVVDDIGDEPGGLPLLSTALLETWERRRGRTLTLSGYAETGGARRAISQLADATYDELTEDGQDAARRLLLRLAAPTASGEDVARPAPLAEVTGNAAMEQVLARFTERRLVTVGRSTVQVAHEALLREWPRFRNWLDADREGRRLQHQIAAAAAEWDAGGRADETLLRGARLAAAADWEPAHAGDLLSTEREFVAASLDARQGELRRARRTLRRFQLLTAALVILFVGALVAGGFALVQRQSAVASANQAAGRGLAAGAQALAGFETDTALLLAVEGYQRDPSTDTENGLLYALNGARYFRGYHRNLAAGIADTQITPDGKTLLLLTNGGELWRYDTTTWNDPDGPLVTGIESPGALSVSRNGRLAAFGAEDGTHVIDIKNGDPVGAAVGGERTLAGSFSPDGSIMVTSGYFTSGSLAVDAFNIASGHIVGSAKPQDNPSFPNDVVFETSPTDDEMVVAQSFSFELQKFGLNGAPIGAARSFQDAVGSIQGLYYSPDGTKILVVGFTRNQLVDASTLEPVGQPFAVRGSRSGDAAFSPDGGLVAVSSDDGSIQVVAARTGELVTTLSGLSGSVATEFLDDDRLLALTNGVATEFDLRRPTALGSATFLNDAIVDIGRVGDSSLIVSLGNSVYRTNAVDLNPLGEPLLSDARPQAMAISPDGRFLAVHGYPTEEFTENGRVRLVELSTGQVVQNIPIPRDTGDSPHPVARMAFSPDSHLLAVGTPTGRLNIIDVATGALLVSDIEIDRLLTTAVTWSADGSTLFVGGQDGLLKYVDPATGSITAQTPLSPLVDLTDIVVVSGTPLVAASSESGEVYLVNSESHQLDGQSLSADGTQLQKIAVTPDGRRIAAVSRDGQVRLWDVQTRRQLGPALRGHRVDGRSASYLPNGNLLTGDAFGVVISWDMAPDAWVQRACDLAGRNLTAEEWQKYLPDQPYRQTCVIN